MSSFASQAVLDGAVTVFRRHGFVGASIQRLVEATGLSRSSLYNRYGDKDGLFVEALRHYLANSCPIEPAEPASEQLTKALDSLAFDGEVLPCLLARSCAELGDLPPAAVELVTGALEDQWAALIEAPSIGGDSAEGTLALALRHGLCALASAGVPRDVLDEALELHSRDFATSRR